MLLKGTFGLITAKFCRETLFKTLDNVLMRQNQLSEILATASYIIINGSYSDSGENVRESFRSCTRTETSSLDSTVRKFFKTGLI